MFTSKRLSAVLFVSALSLTLPLCSRHAMAGMVAGVEVLGVPADPGAVGPPATPRAAEVLIDFDDVPAPCPFSGASPLRDQYLPFGVRFFGVGPTDGGAVLNACSMFGVSGYSGPNFLAFNSLAKYPTLGIATLPETLIFTSPVVAVSILVGRRVSGGTATMEAYDAANNLVATNSRLVASNLAPLTVTATSIQRVVLQGPSRLIGELGVDLVFDDLRFTPGGIVPTASNNWGRLKALYR